MYNIEFTKEEYDTMYESIADYIVRSEEQIKALSGYQNKQNYWLNEKYLATELFDKIKDIEEYDEPTK